MLRNTRQSQSLHHSHKEEFIEFLFCEWKKCDAETLSDTKLFVCHKEMCHSFHSVNNILVVEEVKELRSDHEEADTRLLLHAKHASKAYSTIIIRSPDTCCFHFLLLMKLLVQYFLS